MFNLDIIYQVYVCVCVHAHKILSVKITLKKHSGFKEICINIPFQTIIIIK